jgi:hypothetical protein
MVVCQRLCAWRTRTIHSPKPLRGRKRAGLLWRVCRHYHGAVTAIGTSPTSATSAFEVAIGDKRTFGRQAENDAINPKRACQAHCSDKLLHQSS